MFEANYKCFEWNKDHGCESLLGEVHAFCDKHDIEELDMREAFASSREEK
jgi:hypothetical protein